MRDPWFPIVCMFLVVLAVWLGIAGPIFDVIEQRGFFGFLYRWQTLASAMVALGAAGIAVWNVNRQIRNAEKLERHRRLRKSMALRAALPLVLSAISGYAENCASSLRRTLNASEGESISQENLRFTRDLVVPSDIVESVTDFIEYADELNVNLFADLLVHIQIQNARIRGLTDDRHTSVGRHEIEEFILDAASIYAGAAVAYEFGRRETDLLPDRVTWDDVRSALDNLAIWESDYRRIWESIERRESLAPGPWERIGFPFILDRQIGDVA